jgi:glucokinase
MLVPRQGRRERSYRKGTGATEDAASGRAARPEGLASVSSQPPQFFAVDVGGSAIKSGLVADRKVEELAREPVSPELDGLVAQLSRLVSGKTDWGLSIAGLVDAEHGTVHYAVNLPLRDTRLAELLSPRPRVFVNDLVAATVGEADGGTLALLQVGTGIAGRFARDGVVASAEPYAGEVGHLRFRDDGLACRCGKHGCAEAYGSWGGILERFRAAGRPSLTPVELLEQAATDDWAAEILRDALDAIGFSAATLVAAWDPGTLRLGGGVATTWGETLLDAVRASLDERVLPDLAAGTTVAQARFGDAAPLLGLAALAR